MYDGANISVVRCTSTTGSIQSEYRGNCCAVQTCVFVLVKVSNIVNFVVF
jgi:hypothetical protein